MTMSEGRVVEQSENEYDASSIPPEAGAGGFKATPTATVKTFNSGNKGFMIVWKLDESDDAENEADVGKKLRDYFIVPAADDPWKRLHLGKIQSLCNHLHIPTRGTVESLVEAVNAAGQSQIWTKHETNKNTGEVDTRLAYREPGTPAKPAEDVDAADAPKGNGGKRKVRR